MSENVVALHGTFLPPPAATVDAKLIQELERMLDGARSGEIIGMAGTYLHKDRAASYSFAGVVATYSMLGGLDCAKDRLLRIAACQD